MTKIRRYTIAPVILTALSLIPVLHTEDPHTAAAEPLTVTVEAPVPAPAGVEEPAQETRAAKHVARAVRNLPTIQGIASWYGKQFHGRQTANGERFDMHELTAAHRSLPFGTTVEVKNLANGRSVVVRINDRGPYSGRRVIDLSYGAAKQLGMVGSGTAKVAIQPLSA